MTRKQWHRTLVTIVIVLLALALGFYVSSIVLAPRGGRDEAGLFDGWAMFALIAAIGVGIIDFFVRPLGGRSGDADVLAEAEEARTGSVRTTGR